MILKSSSDYQGIIEYLQIYNLKKNIKDQLTLINPLVGKKEHDVKVHMNKALGTGIITKNEAEFLEIKMALGRMCLDLEQVLDGVYVTMLFYDRERNFAFHGACPSAPVEFFDFFNVINQQGLLNEDCASCGRAVFTQQVVQTNIETSPLWANFKDYVTSFGFKSCTSIPFYTSDGQVAGTFAHYSKNPNHLLTEEEVVMIQEKTAMYADEIQKISDRLHEYTQIGKSGLTI